MQDRSNCGSRRTFRNARRTPMESLTFRCQNGCMGLSKADEIRSYVRDRWIRPAKSKRQSEVSVRLGDVRKAKPEVRRVNHIASAIRSPKKFLEPNGLDPKVRWTGPPSGQGNNTVYTFRFLKAKSPRVTKASSRPATTEHPQKSIFQKLEEMRGIAREMYRRLGGGQKAIEDERNAWPE